jgi:radical SAM protein with 4Fe4S-binding SPASM domain
MPEYFKASRFNVVVDLPQSRVGLFNTLSRALAVLPAADWENSLFGPAPSREAVAELFIQGFLVEMSRDEDQVLAHARTSQAYDCSSRRYLIRFREDRGWAAPGYRPDGYPREMTLRGARFVLDFFLEDLEAHRPRSACLDLLGLEPARSAEAAVFLAESLASHCRGSGIRFTCRMNGLAGAIPPEVVEALRLNGLDQVRLVVSGGGGRSDLQASAARAEKTLRSLPAGLEVTLLGLYPPDKDAGVRVMELLGHLAPVANDRPVHVVLGTDGSESNGPWRFRVCPALPECLGDDDDERLERLENHARGLGFESPSGPPDHFCPVGRRKDLGVGPDGRLWACPTGLRIAELKLGHVRQGVDFRKEAAFMARPLPEECRKLCPYGPLCDGGCRLRAATRLGGLDFVHCPRKRLERRVREYVLDEAGKLADPMASGRPDPNRP